jgi:translation initiation factor IF-3
MDSKYNKGSKEPETRINERIKVPKVLVINNEGENIGEISTSQALEMAKKTELDLVEVSPNAIPPVCRIMNYSKYVYEQNKKMRKNKASRAKDLKEFRFSVVIDKGDIDTRVRRARKFLEKGHLVKITIIRRGRQLREQMNEVFSEILTNFDEYSTIEPEPKRLSNSISITFKKDGKTKNKQNSDKENKDVQSEGK